MAKKFDRSVDRRKQYPQKTLDHLKENGSITPMEAWTVFGCYRLSAVIERLRKKGHVIETRMCRDGQGKQYARYHYRGFRTATEAQGELNLEEA